MEWRSIWREYVAPRDESLDPVFREHIRHLSVIGIRIIAGVCISGVLFFVVTERLVPHALRVATLPAAPLVILGLGLVSLLASFVEPLVRYARALGLSVGYFVSLVQFVNAAEIVERPAAGYFLLSGIVTGVMLIGIATLPLKPIHTFGLGAAILLTYGALIPRVMPQIVTPEGVELILVLQTVLLATGLTIIVYRQRVVAYRARRSARDAFDQLAQAQAKLVVSENAHSQSRFAAALSHELATPLGVLTSAFDTLIEALRKVEAGDSDRVKEAVSAAERSGRQSGRRLRETIARMKYLTNLDRAEEQVVDLNELCRETAASLHDELERKAEVHFALAPLPPFRCRPQQMGAALSNLLRNAAEAIDDRGRIDIVSEHRVGEVVLEVRDDGRGISERKLPHLFEPTFQVAGSRVATTNWGLFVSRAIIDQHGGNLEIESELGKGTTARIVLPLPTAS